LHRSALLIAGARKIGIHEAKGNTICVEECGSKRDPLQDKAQVFDTATLFFELHGTAVVNVQNNVVQGELDDIIRNLFLDAPALNDLVDL